MVLYHTLFVSVSCLYIGEMSEDEHLNLKKKRHFRRVASASPQQRDKKKNS